VITGTSRATPEQQCSTIKEIVGAAMEREAHERSRSLMKPARKPEDVALGYFTPEIIPASSAYWNRSARMFTHPLGYSKITHNPEVIRARNRLRGSEKSCLLLK
jgi:hypothetical protein